MRRMTIAAVLSIACLVLPACQSEGTGGAAREPRAAFGGMGISPPASSSRASSLGPDTFPCRPATGDEDYGRYGVGPMRRGGLETKELEPNHIVLDGNGANFHGAARVTDGGTIELEMDDDYFAPTVLRGPAGAAVTVELENEGTRQHNLRVPGQGIDVNCGVRARGEEEVVFPRSGVLVFTCKYTGTSGMRGALAVRR